MNHHHIQPCAALGAGLALLLAACSAPTPTAPTKTAQPAPTEAAQPAATTVATAEEPEVTSAPRFTIQAGAELQPALAALVGALYEGEAPAFVDEGGDLLAAADAGAAAGAGQAVTFLPGAQLAVMSDNPDAAALVAFAASPDGQQALIDAGLLPDTVTLTDQAGNNIEVPQPVRRIVSPYGVATFYIYGVGAADRLVAAGYLGARDPEGEAAMTRIDPRYPELGSTAMNQNEANVEDIAALNPDLIISSARTEWLDAAAELGVPIFQYEGESPELLKEAMRLTGQMLGPDAAARAEAWVAYYDSIFETVTQETAALADEERVTALFTGTEPLRVASGDMYQTSIIEAAGGVSVSAELVGYWNDVNLEQVVVWNPDVIFVPPYGGASVEAIVDSPEWQALEAVQAGRVFRVPKLVAPWDVPAPDSVLGIIWAAQTLYPDLVTLDCSQEAEYFYQTFYNYDISDEEVANLCGS